MKNRRQHFGQHFLKDRKIISTIVKSGMDAANELKVRHTESKPLLLEIGPGKGAITLPLVDEIKKLKPSDRFPFTVVEKDDKITKFWAPFLAEIKPVFEAFTFLDHDFFDLDLTSLASDIVVVSNLPYSTGTKIVLKLSEHRRFVKHMTLMFQKEVGDRISAPAGTRHFGSLSIHLQNHWIIEPLVLVPNHAFFPPPKVQSVVLTFRPRPIPIFSFKNANEERAFERLVRILFLQKRKMLRAVIQHSPYATQLKEILEKAGIDPTIRAEKLAWDDWKNLAKGLFDNADLVEILGQEPKAKVASNKLLDGGSDKSSDDNDDEDDNNVGEDDDAELDGEGLDD